MNYSSGITCTQSQSIFSQSYVRPRCSPIDTWGTQCPRSCRVHKHSSLLPQRPLPCCGRFRRPNTLTLTFSHMLTWRGVSTWWQASFADHLQVLRTPATPVTATLRGPWVGQLQSQCLCRPSLRHWWLTWSLQAAQAFPISKPSAAKAGMPIFRKRGGLGAFAQWLQGSCTEVVETWIVQGFPSPCIYSASSSRRGKFQKAVRTTCCILTSLPGFFV